MFTELSSSRLVLFGIMLVLFIAMETGQILLAIAVVFTGRSLSLPFPMLTLNIARLRRDL